MDWGGFEGRWAEVATEAILRTARAHPDDTLYAAAFTTFYADATCLLPPALALGLESLVPATDRDAGFPTRWAPVEWHLAFDEKANRAVRLAYEPLQHLDALDERAVADVIEAHYQALARVCRRLTASARAGALSRASLPPRFVVAILYDADGPREHERLVRASVAPEVLAELPGMLTL